MQHYSSIRKLAAAVGIAHTTMLAWLKRKDFPVTREGPWNDDDVAELKAWQRAVLQPDRNSPDYRAKSGVEPPTDEQDKDYWLMRKYRAQALQQEGKLLGTDAVMQAWTRTLTDLREQILMTAASVQTLLGINDEQTRQLDEFLRRTLDGAADYMGDLADATRFVPGGVEGVEAPEAAEAERVGGEPSVHASEHDGQPRPVEE